MPQWYQRRFLRPGARFFYLDLKPETVTAAGSRTYQRRAMLRWGPPSCVCVDELYTIKLGRWGSDMIERRFFGPLDARGERAVPLHSFN